MKLVVVTMLFPLSLLAAETSTRLKSDERIVFYPSVAQRVPAETNLWRVTIRGCVFEPERRRMSVAALREALELKTDDMTPAESAVFAKRARLFLVDHERGKEVFIRIGNSEFFVGKSGADGRFSGEVLLHDTDVERRPPARREGLEQPNRAVPEAGAPFAAVLRPDDHRIFSGSIFPLEAEGLSVISDIDDTIKITEVRDKSATLRNTFLREFQPVPGMAEFYQALASKPLTPTLSPSEGERGDEGRVRSGSNPAIASRADPEIGAPNANVAFHYVSASPWQLYEPLAAFTASNGFPAGTFELKEFRWKDRSFFNLFSDPEKYKLSIIEPLIIQFPKRRFILIGDSGERDPEIYGALARKFPEQVAHICIRDVTGEPAGSARYLEAFREVPRAKWQIFRQPGEIKIAHE